MRSFLIILLAGVALAAPSAAHAATALYPDMRTMPPRNLQLDRTDVSVERSGVIHNVLRFSNTVYNVGEGPVEIRATINQRLSPPAGQAYQRVYDDENGFRDIELTGSTLYYHDVHVHYHFDHWGEYQLWTKREFDAWVASGRTVGAPDLVGTKTTSCVTDEEFALTTPYAVWPEQYPPEKCMPDANGVIAQGLSTGWGDTYDYYRSEQWVDLGTGRLADGTYVLRSVTDPENLVAESAGMADPERESPLRNEAMTTFVISGGQIVDSDAPSGTVTINHVDRITTSSQVRLDVLGRDDVSRVRTVRVSNDGVTWATFSNTSEDSNYQSLRWDLADRTYGGHDGTGERTVCILFQDNAGRWSPVITDTIDYQPPTPPRTPTSAYGRAVAADTPVSWWRLGDQSGSPAVDQQSANAGAYGGTVTYGEPSLIGGDTGNKATAFNGANGTVRVPDAGSLDLTSAITLEAWIKPSSIPASGDFASILTKAESYTLQFNGPRLEFTVMQSGTRRRVQAPAGAVVAGSSYHVVGTYDGVNQRLYVNGTQVATAALTGGATVTANPLQLASWDGTMEFFRGTLDEVAVYGTALSATRVRAHFDAASTATLDAPSNLTAAATSTSQIELRWHLNSTGETGVVVERSRDAAFTSPTSQRLAANTTTLLDGGLASGTTYWYRVKAVTDGDASPWSDVVQTSTPEAASYRAAVLADNPVSYWRLGEGSGTIAGDETVANPGQYSAVTLGVPGLLASTTNVAAGFNGRSSEVRAGQTGSLDITSALTVEAWINPTSIPTAGIYRSIVTKTNAYSLDFDGPQLELWFSQAGQSVRVQAPAGAIVAGTTYHVVGTYDGSNARLYVNGAQVGVTARSGPIDTAISALRIGSWDGLSEWFAGTIDEAAIYRTALSATRIADHYNAGKATLAAPTGLTATASSATRIDLAWSDNAGAESGQTLQRSTRSDFSSPTTIPLAANVQSYGDTAVTAGTTYWYRVRADAGDTGSAWSNAVSATPPSATSYASVVSADAPVSWWRLAEGSGIAAADAQGANNGTYLGSPTLGATGLVPTATGNGAVTFNGRSNSVRVADSSSLDLTSAITLEAWIKPSRIPSSGNYASVVTKPEAYSLQFNGTRLEFTVMQSGMRRRLQAAAGAVVTGTTYHVVATYDGTTQRLYLNGTQVTSRAQTGAATVTTDALAIASWDGYSEWFNGTVDEVAVYRTVLDATRVRAHYDAGTRS
jgi:hypothetical protein